VSAETHFTVLFRKTEVEPCAKARERPLNAFGRARQHLENRIRRQNNENEIEMKKVKDSKKEVFPSAGEEAKGGRGEEPRRPKRKRTSERERG
jgi:hypothetical protein